MALVRGTSLQGFCELVDELGGDTDDLLARAHLPVRPSATTTASSAIAT